jgi:hypothetical protein
VEFHDSKDKRFMDWMIGGLGDWRIGRLEDWEIGGLEDLQEFLIFNF